MNMTVTRRALRPMMAVAFCLAALCPLVVPSPAHAWYRGGFFVGVSPFFFGPPVVFAPPPVFITPPPVIYAPPPVAYAPPSPAFAGQPSRTCFAGGYTCPLNGNFPIGAGCSCPTGRGSAFGRAG